MTVKLAKKTETVYVARCQWVVGQDAEGRDITGFGLLWERKNYADAADIVDRHASKQYGTEGRFYHTWLEQVTRYDDGSEETIMVREYNRPAEPDAIDTSTATMCQPTSVQSTVEAVLTQHHGHSVRVGGPSSSVTRTVNALQPADDLRWQYQGFHVHCMTCGTCLSEQWNV